MTSPGAAAARWQTTGDLWLADDGQRIQIRQGNDVHLQLDGAPAEALRQRSLGHPLLVAMAGADARLGHVLRRLSEQPARPLTRADVLRGSRYELLFVELTSQCNERCAHCYADSGPERTTAMSWETIERVVNDAAELGFRIIQFTGGDPLIHPDVARAVAHAHGRGISIIELYTNGLALTRELLTKLAPYSPAFAFSVYSHLPHIHDAITNVPGSHARTLRAIKSCLERGLSVRAGVTLFEPNHEHRDAIVACLQELGLPASQVGFNTSHAVGRGSYFHGDARDATHGLGTMGGGKACVAPHGDVYPCIFARNTSLGNVHQERLASILRDPSPVAPAADLDGAVLQASQRLSCRDCQLREALLGAEARRQPLVQLRRAP